MNSTRRQLDQLFHAHAVIAIITGGACVFLPHSLAASMVGGIYGHMVHEMVRLYGCLTLAQGWLVWQTRRVSDAFVRKTFCQAYCISFALQVASPDSHSILNWLNILLFFGLASCYGYFLYKPVKVFELPGGMKEVL